MSLIVNPNIAQPDQFYAALLAAHDGLSETDSQSFNARLILLLANHIGDFSILKQALDAATSESLGESHE